MINNFLLDVLAAGAILSGILVITSKNPVIAVLFLISAFCNAAGYLMLLGIGFVGISYIIVYVGAIAVLFLFVIMMLNIRLADIIEVGSYYTQSIPLAFCIGFLFIYEISSILPFTVNNVSILSFFMDLWLNLNSLLLGINLNSLNSVHVSVSPAFADTIFTSFLHIEALGHNLFTHGAIWLILLSIILLLAMAAPIILSQKISTSNQISDGYLKNQQPKPL